MPVKCLLSQIQSKLLTKKSKNFLIFFYKKINKLTFKCKESKRQLCRCDFCWLLHWFFIGSGLVLGELVGEVVVETSQLVANGLLVLAQIGRLLGPVQVQLVVEVDGE